jgi:ketosteroid isomerase-like protein
MNASEVGRTLVDLCTRGRNIEAIDTLFAKDVVSEEAVDSPEFPRVTKGIEGVRAKNQRWGETNEVHGQEVGGPYPNGDEFAVVFALDFTPKAGPLAGRRVKMQEVALYTVKDGKVVHEKFFYSMG